MLKRTTSSRSGMMRRKGYDHEDTKTRRKPNAGGWTRFFRAERWVPDSRHVR